MKLVKQIVRKATENHNPPKDTGLAQGQLLRSENKKVILLQSIYKEIINYYINNNHKPFVITSVFGEQCSKIKMYFINFIIAFMVITLPNVVNK